MAALPNDSTRIGDYFPSGFCYYEVADSLVSQFAFTCQLKLNRNAGRLKRFTVMEKDGLFILGWSRPSGDQPLYSCFTRVHAVTGTIPQLARLEPGCVGSPSIQPVGFSRVSGTQPLRAPKNFMAIPSWRGFVVVFNLGWRNEWKGEKHHHTSFIQHQCQGWNQQAHPNPQWCRWRRGSRLGGHRLPTIPGAAYSLQK